MEKRKAWWDAPKVKEVPFLNWNGRLRKGLKVRMMSVPWHGTDKKSIHFGVWTFVGWQRQFIPVNECDGKPSKKWFINVEMWERNGKVKVNPRMKKVAVILED